MFAVTFLFCIIVVVVHTCAIIGLKPLINLRFVVPFRACFPLHALEYVTQSTHTNNDDNNDDENARAQGDQQYLFSLAASECRLLFVFGSCLLYNILYTALTIDCRYAMPRLYTQMTLILFDITALCLTNLSLATDSSVAYIQTIFLLNGTNRKY